MLTQLKRKGCEYDREKRAEWSNPHDFEGPPEKVRGVVYGLCAMQIVEDRRRAETERQFSEARDRLWDAVDGDDVGALESAISAIAAFELVQTSDMILKQKAIARLTELQNIFSALAAG